MGQFRKLQKYQSLICKLNVECLKCESYFRTLILINAKLIHIVLELTPNGSVIGLDGRTCRTLGNSWDDKYFKDNLPCITPDWTNMKIMLIIHLVISACLIVSFQQQSTCRCKSVMRRLFEYCQSLVLSLLIFPAYFKQSKTLIAEFVFSATTIIQLAIVYFLQGIMLTNKISLFLLFWISSIVQLLFHD